MLQKRIGWLRTIARLTAGTQRHGLDGPGRTCGPSPSHGVSQPIDVLIICCGFLVRFRNSSKRFWSPKELQGPTECWKQPRARTRSPVLGLSWARCASRPLPSCRKSRPYRSALFTFACCPALLVHSMSHFLLRKFHKLNTILTLTALKPQPTKPQNPKPIKPQALKLREAAVSKVFFGAEVPMEVPLPSCLGMSG